MIVKLLPKHHFGVSKLKRRLQRLVRVYTCQNDKVLEISCRGSFLFSPIVYKHDKYAICTHVFCVYYAYALLLYYMTFWLL